MRESTTAVAAVAERRHRLRGGSVHVRIAALAMAVVGGSLAAGSVALLGVLRAGTLRSVRTDAQVRAAEIAAFALRAPLPRPLPVVVGDRPTLEQVVEADGRVSTASAALLGRAPLVGVAARTTERGRSMRISVQLGSGPVPAASLETERSSPGDGRVTEWWVQAVPATVSGRAVKVIVATSLAEPSRTTRQLRGLLFGGVPILTALAGALTWAVVGRSLRPVERLRADVDALARNEVPGGVRVTRRRVIVPGSDDELHRLAATLNRLLDRLDRSAEVQQRFVADASHELRGPVANIRVQLEVASAHPELTDWARVSAEVLAQDERMGRIVDDLLLLARTDDDHIRRHDEPIDFGDVLAEAIARVGSGGPVVVRFVHRDTAPMDDDLSHLSSIATNLIDNAARFARSQVHVSLIRTGRWAEFTVTDDGPGVPPDHRARIFDRFHRVDDDRSRSGGGAGLGLAIVDRLVTDRGGTITVGDAHPGAVFTVRLPLPGRPDISPGPISVSS